MVMKNVGGWTKIWGVGLKYGESDKNMGSRTKMWGVGQKCGESDKNMGSRTKELSCSNSSNRRNSSNSNNSGYKISGVRQKVLVVCGLSYNRRSKSSIRSEVTVVAVVTEVTVVAVVTEVTDVTVVAGLYFYNQNLRENINASIGNPWPLGSENTALVKSHIVL